MTNKVLVHLGSEPAHPTYYSSVFAHQQPMYGSLEHFSIPGISSDSTCLVTKNSESGRIHRKIVAERRLTSEDILTRSQCPASQFPRVPEVETKIQLNGDQASMNTDVDNLTSLPQTKQHAKVRSITDINCPYGPCTLFNCSCSQNVFNEPTLVDCFDHASQSRQNYGSIAHTNTGEIYCRQYFSASQGFEPQPITVADPDIVQ